MKRDRELIRAILLELEASDSPTGLEIEGRFEPYVSADPGFFVVSLHGTEARPALRSRDYQIIQMEKAGLIEFVDEQNSPDFVGGRVRLLPAGHDAVEAISDDKIWAKLIKSTPGEAYSIVKTIASSAGASAIGAAMGWN